MYTNTISPFCISISYSWYTLSALIPSARKCLSLYNLKPSDDLYMGHSCPALAHRSLPVEISNIPSHTVTNIFWALSLTISSLAFLSISAGDDDSVAHAEIILLEDAINKAAGTPLSDTSAISTHRWSSSVRKKS